LRAVAWAMASADGRAGGLAVAVAATATRHGDPPVSATGFAASHKEGFPLRLGFVLRTFPRTKKIYTQINREKREEGV
jgi:hypothetical protein